MSKSNTFTCPICRSITYGDPIYKISEDEPYYFCISCGKYVNRYSEIYRTENDIFLTDYQKELNNYIFNYSDLRGYKEFFQKQLFLTQKFLEGVEDQEKLYKGSILSEKKIKDSTIYLPDNQYKRSEEGLWVRDLPDEIEQKIEVLSNKVRTIPDNTFIFKKSENNDRPYT